MPEPERKYETEAAVSIPLGLEPVSEHHEKRASDNPRKPKQITPLFNSELVVRILERIKEL